MNETITTILNRRSNRDYLNEQIKQEELEQIITAGLHAPSAYNQQSWHFTVIQDSTIIAELNKDTKDQMILHDVEYLRNIGLNENYNLFYDAPTVIVVSGEKSAIFSNIDCAAATENMMIAAESFNIGTCWIGLVSLLFKSDKVHDYIKKLAIPEGFEPYYAVAVGYKATVNQQAAVRRENTVNYI